MSKLKGARAVRDDAWGYGYKEGLERLRDYMQENPSVDPNTLNLASLEPDP